MKGEGLLKLKSWIAIVLITTMGLMAFTALLPTAAAANERIVGTVTEVDTGDPLDNFGVFAFSTTELAPPMSVRTDANGTYTMDLPGPGSYMVVFMNDSWTGARYEVDISVDENMSLDFQAEPDVVAPTATAIDKDRTDGVSLIQPTDIDITVDEENFFITEAIVYDYEDRTDDYANVTKIKTYSSLPEYPYTPGTGVGEITVVDQGSGLNSTSFTFNGSATGGWIGDGTNSWWITTSDWDGNTQITLSYYENDTIGQNNNFFLTTFNGTTGVLEEITMVNTTNGNMTTVDLSDDTGKMRMVADTGELEWASGNDPLSTDQEPVTPFIDINDLQPLEQDSTLPSGDYLIQYRAYDYGDQWAELFWNITIDNTGPTADAGANMTVEQMESAMLNGSASTDDMGIVNYSWEATFDSSAHQYFGEEATTDVIEGIQQIEVELTITDTGGWTDADTMFINVTDGLAPVADAGENITVMQKEEVMFNASGSTDNHDQPMDMNFTWSFNDTGENVTLHGWNATYVFEEMGVYEVELVVTDSAGHASEPDMVWVNVTDGTPPVADAGDDMTVRQMEEVAFNGSGSSDNVDVAEYRWNFTDNGTAVELLGWNATYTFEEMGTYDVTLTVTDAAGHTHSDMLQVTVVDGIAPEVYAGLDMVGEAGESLTFNGSGSSDNVGIVSYDWDFGDNTTAAGMEVQHTYLESGYYTVTLNCTDEQGNFATDTLTVQVEPENTPPEIDDMPHQTAVAGEQFAYNIPADDDDPTDALNFSLVQAPTGMQVNQNSGRITWTPGEGEIGNTYDVRVEVSDGRDKVNGTFTIEVVEPEPGMISVSVGPVENEDGDPVKKAKVILMHGADVFREETDENGYATFNLPGELAGEPVTVKVTHDDYDTIKFDGEISATTGEVIPEKNRIPKMQYVDEMQDYNYLIVVVIVLAIIAVILLCKGTPGKGEEALCKIDRKEEALWRKEEE